MAKITLPEVESRIEYIQWIKKGLKIPDHLDRLETARIDVDSNWQDWTVRQRDLELERLAEMTAYSENQIGKEPRVPWELVNISRSPHRISLLDILQHVYDGYDIVRGLGTRDADPAVMVARAWMKRPDKSFETVWVIGNESGHGARERSMGAANPEGLARIEEYIREAVRTECVAHLFGGTPGAKPIEEGRGAAPGISSNIHGTTRARTPLIFTNYNQGGSGGVLSTGFAADYRLMLELAWLSAISPEGAYSIETRWLKKMGIEYEPEELRKNMPSNLAITADDVKRMGLIDRIVEEPPLGARPSDLTFFQRLRYELMRATDITVMRAKNDKGLESYLAANPDFESTNGEIEGYPRWLLNSSQKEKLVEIRRAKLRKLGEDMYSDERTTEQIKDQASGGPRHKSRLTKPAFSLLKRGIKHTIDGVVERAEEGLAEGKFRGHGLVPKRLTARTGDIRGHLQSLEEKYSYDTSYQSKLVTPENINGAVSCPTDNGCVDVWRKMLYEKYAGICPSCEYHFPVEPEFLLARWFNAGSVELFNEEIGDINNLGFPYYDQRLKAAQKKSGHKSSVLTFKAKLYDIDIIGSMLIGTFWGGTIDTGGAEKIALAIEMAERERKPYAQIVHMSGGVRIQGSAPALCAGMVKTSSVLGHYIEVGGLPISIFAGKTYAGGPASFLGIPRIFGLHSAEYGFAGRDVIMETTGEDIPEDYHSIELARERGHLSGIWRRDDTRQNLYCEFVQFLPAKSKEFLYYG